MRNVVEKTNKGYTYQVTQFDIMTSLSVIRRTGEYCGGAIESILQNYDPDKKLTEQDISKLGLGNALKSICGAMSDKDFMDYVKLTLSCVIIKDAPEGKNTGSLKDTSILEEHYNTAGLDGLFKAIMYSVEVNYKTFLDGIGVVESSIS